MENNNQQEEMEQLTPEELAADETVRKVYLGKDFELKKRKF